MGPRRLETRSKVLLLELLPLGLLLLELLLPERLLIVRLLMAARRSEPWPSLARNGYRASTGNMWIW